MEPRKNFNSRVNKLTKGVLKEFIANSEQSYIAGVFPMKFDDYTAYAEFLRKPMLQKKQDFLMVLMKRVILLIQILKIKILQTAVQPVCFWILPKN